LEPRSSRIMEHLKVYPEAQHRRDKNFLLAQVPRDMFRHSRLAKCLVVKLEHPKNLMPYFMSPKAFKLRPHFANDSAFKKLFFLGDMVLLPGSTDAKKKYAFELENPNEFLVESGYLKQRGVASGIREYLSDFEKNYLLFNPYFTYEVETGKEDTFKFKSPFNETNPGKNSFHPVCDMAGIMHDFVKENCAGKDVRYFGESIFYGKRKEELATFLGGKAPTGEFEHKTGIFATGKDGSPCGPQEPNWVPAGDVTEPSIKGLGVVLTVDNLACLVREDRYFGRPEHGELPEGARLMVCGSDLVPFFVGGEAAQAHAMYEKKKDAPRMEHFLLREALDDKDKYVLAKMQKDE